MKNVNVVVYEFNELSKEVQDKVIQRYREELAGVLDDNVNYIMQQEFNNYTDNLDFSLAYSLYSGRAMVFPLRVLLKIKTNYLRLQG